jgi:ankyrin repeat protein
VNRIMDNDNWTPLHWASRKGHSQIVQLLLENRMPVYSRTKSQDREPLFFAAQYGYLETCRLLLAASADPNAYSKMDGSAPSGLGRPRASLFAPHFLRRERRRPR